MSLSRAGRAAALASLALAGCGGGSDEVTIVVSAASDLRFAFQEVAERFEEESGTRVSLNFGSTGQLALQIAQGAPADVFAAADVSYVDDLVRRGYIISDTRALYARGSIVLWTRREGPVRVDELEDLLRLGVRRISIANPAHAPYGRAAEEALRSAGVWERIQPMLVPAESAHHAMQLARTGNADVGIVPLSLAMVQQDGRYALVAEQLHAPIDQALGVVSSTAHEPEARAFARFVTGPTGRSVLERYGFAPRPKDGT